jgi:hypothetical protein
VAGAGVMAFNIFGKGSTDTSKIAGTYKVEKKDTTDSSSVANKLAEKYTEADISKDGKLTLKSDDNTSVSVGLQGLGNGKYSLSDVFGATFTTTGDTTPSAMLNGVATGDVFEKTGDNSYQISKEKLASHFGIPEVALSAAENSVGKQITVTKSDNTIEIKLPEIPKMATDKYPQLAELSGASLNFSK